MYLNLGKRINKIYLIVNIWTEYLILNISIKPKKWFTGTEIIEKHKNELCLKSWNMGELWLTSHSLLLVIPTTNLQKSRDWKIRKYKIMNLNTSCSKSTFWIKLGLIKLYYLWKIYVAYDEATLPVRKFNLWTSKERNPLNNKFFLKIPYFDGFS